MRYLAAATLLGICVLSSAANAAAVKLVFDGVININGAFPVNPDPVGEPTNGSLTFDSSAAVASSTPTSKTYSDAAGVLKMDFGVAGQFTSFTSNTPLSMNVADNGANTTFRVEAWNGGAPGTGNKGIVLFTLPGTNAFGADHALPIGAFTTNDLVVGGGSITISGGLTSFAIISVAPEPTSLISLAPTALMLRRRHA